MRFHLSYKRKEGRNELISFDKNKLLTNIVFQFFNCNLFHNLKFYTLHIHQRETKCSFHIKIDHI